MLTLIHGDDQAESRKKLIELKNSVSLDAEIIYMDGSKITISTLLLACESKSLFQNQKQIIIENFCSGGITNTKQEILSYINKFYTLIDIIFWEGKSIDKTQVNKFFVKYKIFNYQYPAILFKFIDSLGLLSAKSLLEMLHDLLNDKDAELIFLMIVRQFRFLIIASDLGAKGLGQLASWQTEKIIRQALVFEKDRLIRLYRQLLRIDYLTKTGQTPYNLTQLLDIFLINL